MPQNLKTNSPPKKVIVAAFGTNRVLGKDNRLLWHLKKDLQRFKAATLGKPMIMGRKTYESIGFPLPGRTTIVVTRDPGFQVDSVLVAHTLDEAFLLAEKQAELMKTDEIIISGGMTIYNETIHKADILKLTLIDVAIEGDAYFPEFNWNDYHELERESYLKNTENEYSFSFISLEKKK